MQTFDVIVIGAGGVGSAAAMHLARRGASVLALDRFPPGHDRGSSHGHTRVIRMAYFEHPDYVPLLRRAYQLWADLEIACGETLFHRVGLLQVGAPEGLILSGVRRSAEQHALLVENLNAAECNSRFPGFHVNDDLSAVFEPDAGYLLVERCVLDHLQEASKSGATIRTGIEVLHWRADGGGVIVETDQGFFGAGRLVITAGAWATTLLSGLGVPLRVLRKPLYWFEPRNDTYREELKAPCFLYDLPEGCFYGFPQIDARGVKMAEHSGGLEISDPLNVSRSLDENDCARVAAFAARWMPHMTTRLVDHRACLYTMSPDEHFLVDRHPEFPQVAFAAGLSGHGFKFTSVLGEILCDLSLEGRSSLPIAFLSLRRLVASDSRLLKSSARA